MKEKGKKKLIHQLKSKYRLTILNEKTFSEKFSLLLTPMNVIVTLLLFLILFGGLVYAIIAFTPLKESVIPGYTDDEYRENAKYSRMMVDSLLKESQRKEMYLENLSRFMNGESVELNYDDSIDYDIEDLISEYILSEADSVLREKVDSEGEFEIDPGQNRDSNLKNLFLFVPVNGSVSSEFDATIGHYGIDLIAPKNTTVKAVMDGTVITSAFTTEDGHVIQIQHDHNLISCYKHNSAVFKEVGDIIKAGDAIAVIGDSGDHSDGPHLHFELWLRGVPVNPRDFFAFEE